MRQFSQIVAEYPAVSISTKLSSGIRSLRNAQVASTRHLSFYGTFLLALPALKRSSLQSAFSPLEAASVVPAANSATLMEPCP
ncbi:hypothetical protein E6H13_05970 [Candidatus Bathyarchaeota archaeon]|nr:MAG: hypothetical protein E6H13_05970 [Candidatus Bathyarchaeota archaeon]